MYEEDPPLGGSPSEIELYSTIVAPEFRSRWEQSSRSTSQTITSYGMVICRWCEAHHEWLFLIAQRRDTIAYSEFIKARVRKEDLAKVISQMTREEINRLANHPFPVLWRDFWMHTNSHLFVSEYDRCAKEFPRNVDRLRDLATEAANTGLAASPWGFPKGRKKNGEGHLECALREFEEETHIPRTAVMHLPHRPVEEIYMGTDGLWYRTIYFLGAMTHSPNIKVMHTPHNIRKTTISEEVAVLSWSDIGKIFKRMDQSRRAVARYFHQYLLRTVPNNSRYLVGSSVDRCVSSQWHPNGMRAVVSNSTARPYCSSKNRVRPFADAAGTLRRTPPSAKHQLSKSAPHQSPATFLPYYFHRSFRPHASSQRNVYTQSTPGPPKSYQTYPASGSSPSLSEIVLTECWTVGEVDITDMDSQSGRPVEVADSDFGKLGDAQSANHGSTTLRECLFPRHLLPTTHIRSLRGLEESSRGEKLPVTL